jgi:Domain of unknown function (DUF5658)
MDARDCITDRRARWSRRSFSWRTVLYGHLHSNRRAMRRVEDTGMLFPDWHHPWQFFLALGIMLLSCVDAFMTLQLLEHGMVEANPAMAAALSQGTAFFAATKVALTGAGVMILVYLANTFFMKILRTGLLLTIFFSAYCCLVCYQIVHLLHVL